MSDVRSKIPHLGRLLVYLLLQAVALAVYVEVVQKVGFGQAGEMELEDLLRENKWLEWIQIGLLGVIGLICVRAFRARGAALHRILGVLALFAIFRELDSYLEDILFENAHTIGMGFAVLAGIVIGGKAHAELRREIPKFVTRSGFYMMFVGVSLVAVYAQILGQREIWEILAEDNVSETKRFIEEGLEMMGYLVIGFGVFEERFFGERAEKNDSPPDAES